MSSTPPPLVLIHGWGLGRAAWEPAQALLARTWPGPVELLDLPGYGGATDHADFLHAANALAEALPDGALPCAWSMGALLLLRAVAWQPGRWPALVLVGATPCFSQRPDWPAAQDPQVLAGFRAAVETDPEATRKRFVALVHQGDAAARTLMREDQRALADGRHPTSSATALATGLDWLRDVDLRALVPHVTVPTLVLHGAQDTVVPPEAGRWLADHLPRSRWLAIEGAAHAPFRSAPETFARALVQGLDALGLGTGGSKLAPN